MVSALELKRWIATVPDTDAIAIDDGGLTLVTFDEHSQPQDAYIEVGGIPETDTDEP